MFLPFLLAAFQVFSWGGSRHASNEYLHEIGVNTVNCWPRFGGTNAVFKCASNDFDVCIRYENARRWSREKRGVVDWERVRREVAEDFAPYLGFERWTMTLDNSELDDHPAQALKDDPPLRDEARTALGFEPDFGFRYHDGILEVTNAASIKGCRGVIGHTNAVLETMRYFRNVGRTNLKFTRIAAEEINKLRPENVVWSEPLNGGIAAVTDMCADWLYEYSEYLTLGDLRRMYSVPRSLGKPFMPTLSMCYYPAQTGVHPVAKDKNGKPVEVRMAQSCDELIIKSYLAIGAVKASALSLFHADTWYQGEMDAKKYLENSEHVMKELADPGSAARYGRFMQERFKPLAELFKETENVRAPLAIYVPEPVGYVGGWQFGLYHYRRMLEKLFGEKGIPYDFIGDHEVLKPEVLSQYRYLFMPMCNVMYSECDEAIRAAAEKGLVVILDRHGKLFKDRYPNSEFHNEFYYKHIWISPEETYGPIGMWCDSMREKFNGLFGAWSDGDAGESFTFVKEAKDATYLIVVNNRREDGGVDGGAERLLTTFKKTKTVKMPDDYRPYGAPRHIVTHLKGDKHLVIKEVLPEGKALKAKRVGDEWIIKGDYAPAQGRVFKIVRK